MAPIKNQSPLNKHVILGCLLALSLLVLNSAQAFYSFVRNSQRTTWPTGAFSTEHNATMFQGIDLSGINIGSVPNNNTTGLLVAADAAILRNQVTPINCTDGSGDFGPPAEVEYDAIFEALASWNTVATAIIDFAFVCAVTDITFSSFDNVDDMGTLDLEIWRDNAPVFNGINEIAFDDTTDSDMINALGLGIDPSVLLGLALPFDTAQNLITDTTANGTIDEAFVLINIGPVAPTVSIQAVVTHELGHLLGLGHTGTISNIVAANDALVPTMHFAALGDDMQTESLEIDDIAAITVSYPAAGEPMTSFGSISGMVTSLSGTALRGAGIIAIDAAGNEVGLIIGGDPAATSFDYVLEGVPAGDYSVYLTPLDGSSASGFVNTGNSGNVDGIFFSPALTFPQVYFDDQTMMSDADTVTVMTGTDTPNIDFGNIAFGEGGLVGVTNVDPDSCQSLPAESGPYRGSGLSYLFLLLPFLLVIALRKAVRKTSKKTRSA